MNEFSEFYKTLEVDNGLLFMLMLMSVFVAIFHTVILMGLYEIDLKPKWLFFVLNPLLIWLASLYDSRSGALVAIVLFLSVFVLGILGMIVSAIRSGLQSSKEEDERRKRSGKPALPIWKKILLTLAGLIFFGLVLSLGVPYFIIIVFIILPFLTSLKPNNKKRFYKFQRTLPTSNIRSVAMGLAEISGTSKTIEPMMARIGKKECIGYLYTIETVSTDKDGKDSYSLESSETICNPFFLQDKSGQIKVVTDDIEFIDFEIDEQYQSSMKRYTQYLMKEDMEVLLIGKAGLQENNEPVFQKEEIKDVFGISPVKSVENYNTLRPILQSAGYFVYFWVILIALIFLTPISLTNNGLKFGKINMDLPFKNSKPVRSVTDFYDNIYDSYEQTKPIDSTDQQQAEGAEVTKPSE
ncbi:MAG: EI24 domain-containing protein [Chryseobacterium sp.]|nr:EI24 domain-containing protein [Chryseobacterium sp.]